MRAIPSPCWLRPSTRRCIWPARRLITDGELVLAESGAVVDYIVAKYGNGRLVLGPTDPAFAQFLYWVHFANGSLQPGMGRMMILNRLDLAKDNPTLLAMKGRLDQAYDLLDAGFARPNILRAAPSRPPTS